MFFNKISIDNEWFQEWEGLMWKWEFGFSPPDEFSSSGG
jgi:hypothetical protein